jgi:hypothetical protein
MKTWMMSQFGEFDKGNFGYAIYFNTDASLHPRNLGSLEQIHIFPEYLVSWVVMA